MGILIKSYEDLTDVIEVMKHGRLTPEIVQAMTNVIWTIFNTAQDEDNPNKHIARACCLKAEAGPAEQIPASYLEVSFRIPL